MKSNTIHGLHKFRRISFAVGLSLLAVMVQAPAQETSPAELFKSAAAAYERGDIPQAIRLYEQLLRLQPDSVEAKTNLAVALVRAGRHSEAIALYEDILKRDPKNPVVRMNLALARYKQGEYSQAAAELERLRNEHPDNRQALYLLADCYLRLDRNKDVVQLLQPVQKSSGGEDRTVDYLLGTALIRDGQVRQGEVIIDRILRDGGTPEANMLLGSAQLAAGDHKAAVLSLRKAVDLNPGLPAGWSLYGRALLDDLDAEGARNAFRRALEADPNDFDANLYLGGILRRDGKTEEAAPFLERALRLRPGSVPARYQVGALNASRGRLKEALDDLEQVARQSPDFQQAHVLLASVYQRLNRPEDSRREREIVRELDAKSRDAAKKPAP
jgi:tetratricopeptide (TPR) repeat protein